jgi:hypothetical protein
MLRFFAKVCAKHRKLIWMGGITIGRCTHYEKYGGDNLNKPIRELRFALKDVCAKSHDKRENCKYDLSSR